VAVAQDGRADSVEQVDVVIAVDVDYVRAAGALDVERIGFEELGVAADSAGKDFTRVLVNLARARSARDVGVDEFFQRNRDDFSSRTTDLTLRSPSLSNVLRRGLLRSLLLVQGEG